MHYVNYSDVKVLMIYTVNILPFDVQWIEVFKVNWYGRLCGSSHRELHGFPCHVSFRFYGFDINNTLVQWSKVSFQGISSKPPHRTLELMKLCSSHRSTYSIPWGLTGGPWAKNFNEYPDNKVDGANMGPTWFLSAPDGPHVGPMNLVIRVSNQRSRSVSQGQAIN